MNDKRQVICYDPRDMRQSPNFPATWKPTDNPALIIAHYQPRWRQCMEGFWSAVARNANYCDERVPIDPGLFVPTEKPPASWDAEGG